MRRLASAASTRDARVQKKSTAVRGRRRDKHEHQAEMLARRFTHGDMHLGRHVTCTSTASFTLPTSGGAPLPTALRVELERAFDANLRDVRIHAGAPAAAAAGEMSARAFTAGASIYFATGAYAPGTEEGKELIAHEVVHVLQQTGRLNSEGKLEARSVTGSGLPQMQDEMGPDVPGVAERFTTLADAHRALGTSGTDLEATITAVGNLIGSQLLDSGARPAFAWPLVLALRNQTLTFRHARSRSFLVDCLKWLGYFHTAKALLDADGALQVITLVHSTDFDAFLLAESGWDAWAGGALHHRSLQDFWPSVIVSPYRQFFLTPHAPPPQESAALVQRATETLQARPGPGAVASRAQPQDRVMLAWVLLVQLDRFRVRDCSALRGEVEAHMRGLVPTERLARGVQQVRTRERDIIRNLELPEYRRTLAERLIEMLEREVMPLWDAVEGQFTELRLLFESLSDFSVITGDFERDDFPASLAGSPIANEIRRILLEQVRQIFQEGLGPALENGSGPDSGASLPAPDVYAARMAAFVTALDSPYQQRGRRREAILQQIDALIRAAATGARRIDPTSERAGRIRALALLSWATDSLIWQAQQYDAARDSLTPNVPDELGAHRVRFARACARVSRWMGWTDVVAALEHVMPVAASTAVSTVAQLWLESDWEPVEAPLTRLAEDFPSSRERPVIEGLPISIDHLIAWFRLRYEERLAAVIRSQLVQEHRADADIRINWREFDALEQTPEQVRDQMLENAEAEHAATAVPPFEFHEPQRFVVEHWEAVIPERHAYRWDDLVRYHPKTQLAIYRRLSGDHGYAIIPTAQSLGVFLWVIPPIDDLVELVASMQTLRAMTGFSGTDGAYLHSLRSTFDTDFLLWQRISEAIAQRLADRRRPTRDALPALYTRFTTLRRRSVTADVRARLETYLGDRRVTGGAYGERPDERVRRIEGPQYALDQIQRFALDAVPREEADAQTTLLMLRIADQMARLFTTDTPEYRLAPDYYTLIGLALDFSGDSERMRMMARITNEYDVAAGNVALIERNLTAARAHLQRAREAIEANARASQANLGFESDTRNGTLILMSMAFRSGEIWPTSETNPDPRHQWHRNQRLNEEGELDENTGDVIRILEVFGRFQYRPHVGTPGGSTPYVPPIYWNADGVEHGGQTGIPIPHDPLFRIQLGTEIRTVYADDPPEQLAYYNELFLWRGLQIHLENLGAFTEAYMQWVIAATSLAVPAVAQAELAANVVRFVTTDELQQMIDHLANDPRAFITGLITRLTSDLFHTEHIWRYVLLAGQHNPWNSLRSGHQPRTSLRGAPPRTRLGRVVRSLRLLGERFHNALNRVRLRARGPIRTVQGNLAMRPRLSWVMRRAIQVLQVLPDLIPPELVDTITRPSDPHAATRHPESLMGLVQERIDETEADLRANTIRLLESIQHFELPSELVSLDVATELIIQLIADRFGPRARIIRMLLDITPVPQGEQGRFTGTRTLYQYLAAAVAQAWRASGLDPNQLWVREVVPEIEPRFITIRDEFVTDMYDSINAGLGAMGMRPLERPPAEALPVTEIIPEPLETQPALSPSPAARTPGAWSLSRSSARPLTPQVRRPFETAFGQRFSHVRLTTGESARSATGPIGADAVTSGSHVYLRPGVSPSSHTGQRLLAHELTHVVQQTGSHPLGGAAAPVPRLGAPGRLRIDPVSEAAAERAAGSFMRGASSPLARQTAAPLAAAPAVSASTMRSIIETLTEVRGAADFTADAATARANGLSDARALFELIWQKLLALQATNDRHFARFTANPTGVPTPSVRERIKAHVTHNKSELTGAIEGIVRLSQRPRTGAAATAAAGGTGSQPATELDRGRFVELVENYIFAQRGIGLDTTGDATWRTVSNVKVIAVALDRVGGTSELWTVVMRASFMGRTVTVTPNLQNAVRQRIRAMGPDAIVWDSNEFKLAGSFVDDFIQSREVGGVAITDVPPKHEYLAHGTLRGSTLSIKTHGDLTHGLNIGSFGRESHHTTQYLLAEFFGNHPDATSEAFPEHHPRYPSAVKFVRGTRGQVRDIEAPGESAIRISALDPTSGRGDAMPAVLLSARCHKRGNLHILAEAQWDPDALDRGNRSTQGYAISNTFNRELHALEPRLMPRQGGAAAIQRFGDYVLQNPAAANQKFYRAVVATYHWMRGRMLPALQHGLKTEELAYYRAVAALHHTTGGSTDNPQLETAYDLTESDMQNIYEAARENNDRVMQRLGWPTP